jgi:predicted phosphodiesterase
MTSFSWLHITDLHQGMPEQKETLSDIRSALLRDLETDLFNKCGPWDLVLFTGDMTFKGDKQEFKDLERFLGDLWKVFERKKCNPRLLAVPGNHDLARPTEASAKTLRNWDDEVRQDFWNNPQSPFRAVVNNAFSNYSTWWENQKYKPSGIQEGDLPGDFSYTLVKDDAKLGILGLNTSFLQLEGGDYYNKLALNIQQFNNALPLQEGTEQREDRRDWINNHNVCLLLTHHPLSWLNPTSQSDLQQRIMGAGFAIHLHGHMHEPRIMSVAESGSETKLYCQGRSVFGMEYYDTYIDDVIEGKIKKQERRPSYGYMAGRISLKNMKGSLTFWPREVRELPTKIKIAPDHQCFDLVNDERTNPVEFNLISPYSSQEPDYTEGSEPKPDDELIQRCSRLAEHFPEKYQQIKAWKQLHKILQLYIAKLSNKQNEIAQMRLGGQYSQIFKQTGWWPDQTAELRAIINFIQMGIINPELKTICDEKGIEDLDDNCNLFNIIRPSLLSNYKKRCIVIEVEIREVNKLITSEGGVRDGVGDNEVIELVKSLSSLASESNTFLVAIDSELQKANEELNKIIQELKFDSNY